MILILDTDEAATSSAFNLTAQIDGVEYVASYAWVTREAAWYLNLADQDGNPIALSIKLVLGASLLRRFSVDPRTPAGMLFVCDMTGQDQEIGVPSDLGTRVLLLYFSADEFVS